jgi:hypothetical protein
MQTPALTENHHAQEPPTTATRGRSRRLPAALRHLLLLGGFGLVSVVFTWPLVTNISGSVILARGGDAWLHLWDLWWVKHALTVLHTSPFYTNYLYYPTGVSLYYHSLDTVNSFVSIPMQSIFGLVTSFNILLLIAVALSGYTAFLLIHEVTGNMAASVIGALIFALSPVQSTSIELGQLDQVSMQWIPLYLLFLIRASKGKPWVNVPAAGLFFALASLATWYFSMALVIVTALFVIYEVFRRRSWAETLGLFGRVAGIVGVFLVLMSPMLIPMVLERAQGGQYMVPAFGTTVYNSADLVEFFRPARGNALSTDYNHGVNLAMGYLPLLLGIAGAVFAWKKSRFWVLVGGVLFVLALGPLLRVAGSQTGIPLPYYLIYSIPGAAISRQPLRFDAVMMLALGVVAALGLTALIERAGQKRTGLQRVLPWALPTLCGAVILFEFLLVPRPVDNLSLSNFYSTIAKDRSSYAVLELPSSALARSMYEQTIDEKPIIGGYTSRHFPYPFSESTPGVRQLFLPEPGSFGADIFQPSSKAAAQDVLDYYGIKWVVLHKKAEPKNKVEATRESIAAIFGGKPDYKDPEVAAYQVRPSHTMQAAIGAGEGWYNVESSQDGSRWRWTDGNAGLNLISLKPEAQDFDLRLSAHSFNKDRTIDFYLGSQLVLSEKIGLERKAISLQLKLAPGANSLRIISREPAESPSSLALANDDRNLAVGFSEVTLSPSH